MSKIQLESVSKRFQAIPAVQELSFSIEEGEFFVLLGPTGAGKTTTLRLIAGLEKPDSGRISMNGQEANALSPAERELAFVFQQYSLYPHYSVYDNLAFPLRASHQKLNESQIQQRVQEIAALLKIESKLNNPATQLSGGEMQRVSIGKALVRNPKVFLMDEPLSSLDAKLREELRVELKRIQKDLWATILYVTHDPIEAMTLANRIGVMAAGKLMQVGAPREIYQNPCNVYVAKRLGSPQINLLAPQKIAMTHLPKNVATIGIRPEDIHPTSQEGLQGTVTDIEHLGTEKVVSLNLQGESLHMLARLNQRHYVGETLSFQFSSKSVLWFDEQGQRILPNSHASLP